MSFPTQSTLDHEILPEIRRSIREVGRYRPDGNVADNGGNHYREPNTDELSADTRDALFTLLALVHDLASEVATLRESHTHTDW